MRYDRLVLRVAEDAGIEPDVALRAILSMSKILQENAGGSIRSQAVGQFDIRKPEQRIGRNLATGERIIIPLKLELKIVFKPIETSVEIGIAKPAGVLPEIRLVPVNASQTDKTIAEHKIGGVPDWIQGAEEDILCCQREMHFYGQLASIGGEYDLVDAGMIYVFFCYKCFNTRSFIQYS